MATAENKPNRQEMLSLYRKALSKIASIKNVNIATELSINIKSDSVRFCITVLDKGSDNISFDFYDWWSKEDITESLNDTINLIKTDDFLKIEDGWWQ